MSVSYDMSKRCKFECMETCPLSSREASEWNAPILLQIGTSGLRDKDMSCNDRFSGSGGQRSRLHDAEVSFGGLAVVSFSTRSVE